jgi:hypothetical protein
VTRTGDEENNRDKETGVKENIWGREERISSTFLSLSS